MKGHVDGSKKLGQLLVERGWITGEQLIRAIQSQRMVGGRIGTCLLEMDVLTEERLLDALSQQLAVPSAGVDLLRGVDDYTLELVPAKVAHRCRAVPFFANKDKINVATLEVHNLSHLDELKFCTNKQVVPHIANEVRIFEALERYYGVELPRRYGHLLDRLNRSRYLWDESAKILFGTEEGDDMVWTDPEEVFEIPGLIRAASANAPVAVSTSPARPLKPAAAVAPTPAPAPVEAPAAQTPAAAAPTAAPKGTLSPEALSLEDVDRLFGRAADQHELADIMLRFLRGRFDRAAIFKVMPDKVGGWRSSGDFQRDHFETLALRLDAPSIFRNLKQGQTEHVGPLSPNPVHLEMARSWGGGLPTGGAMLIPIAVRGRMVAVLYGDRGANPAGEVPVEALQRLADKASMAFELFILRRKVAGIR